MKKGVVILITLGLLVGIIISIATVAAPPEPEGPPADPVGRLPAFSPVSLVILGASLFGIAFRRMRQDTGLKVEWIVKQNRRSKK